MQNELKLLIRYGNVEGSSDEESLSLNFLNSDVSSTQDQTLYPIRVPQNSQQLITSYERWFRIQQNSINEGKKLQNFKVFQSTNAPSAGFTIFYKSTGSNYEKPKQYTQLNWQSNNGFTLIPTAEPQSNLIGNLSNINDKTDYGVLVLQVTSEQVSCLPFQIVIQYDEVFLPCPSLNLAPQYPQNNATNISLTPTIQWTCSPEQTAYKLYYKLSTTQNYSSTPNYSGLSKSYTIPASLYEGKTYNWRVVQENEVQGVCSKTTSLIDCTFTTLTNTQVECYAITLSNASHTVTSTTATISVTANDFTGLTLYYKIYGTSTYTPKTQYTSNSNLRTFTLDQLQLGQTYVYYISQINTNGQLNCLATSKTLPTNINSPYSFVVQTYCTKPSVTLVGPANGQQNIWHVFTNSGVSVGSKLTFNCNGQTHYKVFIKKTTESNWNESAWIESINVSNEYNPGILEFALVGETPITYEWYVLQKNASSGCIESISDKPQNFTFTTQSEVVTDFEYVAYSNVQEYTKFEQANDSDAIDLVSGDMCYDIPQSQTQAATSFISYVYDKCNEYGMDYSGEGAPVEYCVEEETITINTRYPEYHAFRFVIIETLSLPNNIPFQTTVLKPDNSYAAGVGEVSIKCTNSPDVIRFFRNTLIQDVTIPPTQVYYILYNSGTYYSALRCRASGNPATYILSYPMTLSVSQNGYLSQTNYIKKIVDDMFPSSVIENQQFTYNNGYIKISNPGFAFYGIKNSTTNEVTAKVDFTIYTRNSTGNSQYFLKNNSVQSNKPKYCGKFKLTPLTDPEEIITIS